MIQAGDKLDLREGEEWVPCRVLTGWHEGLPGIVFVVRRSTDGQRLMMRLDGDLVEVPG